MTNRSRRGAARVSITWMIVVLIAFFAALAMVFVFDGELEKERLVSAQAKVDLNAAQQKFVDELQISRSITEVVGFYDHDDANSRTKVDQANEGVALLKDAFNIREVSVVDFETVAGRTVEERRKLTDRVRDLEAQVSTLTADIAVRTTTLATMTTDKDGQIRTLTQQLNDANQSAADRQNELEAEIASVRATLSETETEVTDTKGELSDLARAKAEREAEHVSRNENLTRVLEWMREPERPDGQILHVSEKLGLAYIDLGKSDRLYAGMRFAIVDGRVGDDTIKARCEVLNVMSDMSEVRITDLRDTFDPVTLGDIIFNPIYDPTGLRNAVFVGRFSGTYNEAELRAMLDGININVQAKMDKTTDYLIVGSEIYVDEDGETLDEPLQPSDLPIYKEARAMGVRIVPVKLITDYFRKVKN